MNVVAFMWKFRRCGSSLVVGVARGGGVGLRASGGRGGACSGGRWRGVTSIRVADVG